MGEPDRAGRAPRVDHIETHAGVFEGDGDAGLYAAADIDDDDAARAYVDVQVVLTRTEAAEVRALQRRAAKASPPRDTARATSPRPTPRRGPCLIDPRRRACRGGTCKSLCYFYP